MLPGCLEPLAGHVDEIVVVDTGSGDRTVEIARSFGATVVHVPWTGSFSDARNASIEAASGDWLIYLDADEHLEAEDAPRLRDLLGRTWREGFHLVETNYTGGAEAGSAVTHMALRVWRNRPHYRFEGRIHEQKTQTMPTYLPERFETTTIRVRHYGYLNHRIASREKSRRNVELLEQEAAEAPTPFTDYNLGSEYLAMGDARRARTHFDRSWDELHRTGALASAGYAPLLAARVAKSRREAGDHAAAAEAVERGLALFPDHTDLVMEAALSARATGDRERARELAQRCLEMGDAPAKYAATVGAGSFLALSLLAELARDAGRPQESEQFLRRALAEHPEYALPVLPLVAGLIAAGSSAEEIAAAVPDRPIAHLLTGAAHAEAGREAAAVPWFERTLAAQPQNAAARIGLADALLATGDAARAAEVAAGQPAGSHAEPAALRIELFARILLDERPQVDALLAERGGVLAAAERELIGAWADRLAGRGGAAGTLPEASSPLALQMLEALLRIRRFDLFEQLLECYWAIAADRREQRHRLARVYFRQGFLESAADEWIAVARERPDSRCMLGLAQVAVARGLPADAAGFAAEAVRLDPADAAARAALESLAGRAAA
jgi:tetratricopeptide (TPR) repeat protein